jgi:hypothetical protein
MSAGAAFWAAGSFRAKDLTMSESPDESLARIRGQNAPDRPAEAPSPSPSGNRAGEGTVSSPVSPTAIPLDARAAVAGQQFGFGCLLALGFMLAFFLGLIAVFAVAFAAFERDVFGAVVSLVFVGMTVGVIVTLVKWMRRRRTWLSGTTLIVRGPFGTHTCDLATSPVSVDSAAETRTVSGYGPNGTTSTTVATGRRIPYLVLREAGTGKVVRLVLRGARGRLLPPDQLHLLATALSAGPRPQPYDQQAQQIAAGLRELADNPFSGHI